MHISVWWNCYLKQPNSLDDTSRVSSVDLRSPLIFLPFLVFCKNLTVEFLLLWTYCHKSTEGKINIVHIIFTENTNWFKFKMSENIAFFLSCCHFCLKHFIMLVYTFFYDYSSPIRLSVWIIAMMLKKNYMMCNLTVVSETQAYSKSIILILEKDIFLDQFKMVFNSVLEYRSTTRKTLPLFKLTFFFIKKLRPIFSNEY